MPEWILTSKEHNTLHCAVQVNLLWEIDYSIIICENYENRRHNSHIHVINRFSRKDKYKSIESQLLKLFFADLIFKLLPKVFEPYSDLFS